MKTYVFYLRINNEVIPTNTTRDLCELLRLAYNVIEANANQADKLRLKAHVKSTIDDIRESNRQLDSQMRAERKDKRRLEASRKLAALNQHAIPVSDKLAALSKYPAPINKPIADMSLAELEAEYEVTDRKLVEIRALATGVLSKDYLYVKTWRYRKQLTTQISKLKKKKTK